MIYYKDFPFENPCIPGSPEASGPGGATKLKLQVFPLCFFISAGAVPLRDANHVLPHKGKEFFAFSKQDTGLKPTRAVVSPVHIRVIQPAVHVVQVKPG
jgi:hypothetical protein